MRSVASACLLCVLLTPFLGGCGGSGGGSKAKLAAITDQNVYDLVDTSVGSSDFLVQLSDLLFELAAVIEGEGEGTFPCDLDGTVDVALNDVAPVGQLSPGDSATISFDGCVMDLDGDPVTFRGTIHLTVPALAGPAQLPSPPWEFRVVYTFTNVRVEYDDGDVITLDGGAGLTFGSDDNLLFETTIDGTKLVANVAEVGEAPFTVTLSDFEISETLHLANGAYVVGFVGDFSHSRFGGLYHYETSTALAGVVPGNPESGIFFVRAPNGSIVTVFALGGDAIRLEADFDADGTPDLSKDTTWTALLD